MLGCLKSGLRPGFATCKQPRQCCVILELGGLHQPLEVEGLSTWSSVAGSLLLITNYDQIVETWQKLHYAPRNLDTVTFSCVMLALREW